MTGFSRRQAMFASVRDTLAVIMAGGRGLRLYFLSGVEFGGVFDYYWGDYDPVFYTDSGGKRVKLIPGEGLNAIATPLGNLPVSSVSYGQYRMKIFMRVNF